MGKEQRIKEQADLFTQKFHSIDKLYEEYAKSVGLTYMSLIVLEVISSEPENCTQKLICEQSYLPKQTVNTIIRSFLDQGLVELKELDSDRRNKRVWLSEAGEKYADKIVGRMWKAEQRAMGRLTAEQRDMMVKVIEIYEASLKECILAEE